MSPAGTPFGAFGDPRFAPEPDPDADPYLDRNPGPDPGPDDVTAALLRGVLHRQGEAVHPSPDGLARILAAAHGTSTPAGPPGDLPGDLREPGASDTPLPTAHRPGRVGDTVPLARQPLTLVGTRGERPRGLVRWMPVLSAAAAVMVVFAGLGMARAGWLHNPGLDAVVGRAPAVGASHPAPAEPLPVYLTERQNGHWALVREFVPTTLVDPADRLTQAIQLAVAGTGTDPDHSSAWRTAGLRDSAADEVTATSDATGVIVKLPAALLGTAPKDPGQAPPAQLAVQQLVWTATATTHTTGAVRIAGPTSTAVLFGSYRLGGSTSRDASDRAPVSVDSLVDGQRLVAGRAVIQGDAVQTTRGTVAWRLIDAHGVQVNGGQAPLRPQTQDQQGQLRIGDRGVWEVALQLPAAGRYRFEVAQPWPGTRNAADPVWLKVDWVDTKTLLVQ
jgi:hypothetical protein